jgi:hypothetical protein
MAWGLSALGVLFLHRLGDVGPAWTHAYCAIWVGFSLTIAGLMLWHFFLPVNEVALVTFAGVALLATIVERQWFLSLLKIPLDRAIGFFIAGFALWTANHTLSGHPALAYGSMDDYVYEFSTIHWFHDYPLIHGLGNLHPFFAFNNSHHLFAAMLSVGLWRGAVNCLFNGFFVALVCILFFAAARDLARGAEGSLQRSLFPALLICPCLGLVLFGPTTSMLTTLKADVFVGAASALLAVLFLWWSYAPSDTPLSRCLSATVLLVGCLIPTVKLSGLVFSGLIVAVMLLRFFASPRESRENRLLGGSLAVCAVLLVCFAIRGIVLSGYPFYPSTAFRFNADWTVPAAQARSVKAFITSFARLETPLNLLPRGITDWTWLRHWAQVTLVTDRFDITLPLALTLACIPMLIFSPRQTDNRAMNEAPPAWAYATVAAAATAAILAWLILAPAGRFAISWFWILFASVFDLAVRKQAGRWNWRLVIGGLGFALAAAIFVLLAWLRIPDRRLILSLLVLACLWLLAFGLFFTRGRSRPIAALCLAFPLYQIAERTVLDTQHREYADVKSILWANVPHLSRPATATPVFRQTCSGLKVYDLRLADYETPLPTTIFFNPHMELRSARMQDGFRNASQENPFCGFNPCVLRTCESASPGHD